MGQEVGRRIEPGNSCIGRGSGLLRTQSQHMVSSLRRYCYVTATCCALVVLFGWRPCSVFHQQRVTHYLLASEEGQPLKAEFKKATLIRYSRAKSSRGTGLVPYSLVLSYNKMLP
jgi:hypothetical protein